MKFLSEFDSFLMYVDNHTKSHNFLKISMFSNKMFTFSSSAHLFEKINISHEIQFFFSQNWHFCTKIDVEKNTRHFTPKFVRHDFITVLKNSLIRPKTNTFCIKWHFLPKGNYATKNWHFSKTENTSLRNLLCPLETIIFENSNHLLEKWKYPPILAFLQTKQLTQNQLSFARKMKISFNIGVSARFPLIPVKHR